MMVYCKLLSRNENISATYAFGKTEKDMTGKIIFYTDGKAPEIVNQPESGSVSTLWIGKLMNKYRASLKSGDFVEKMAYEC